MQANPAADAGSIADYFGDGWELCIHLNVVHIVRELVCGILHSYVPSTLIVEVAQKAARKVRALKERGIDRMVQPAEQESLRDILQSVQGINYAHRTPVTKEGQAAVYALKCAVYGDEHISENALELVAYSSMTKALVFRQACIAMLKGLINCSNCLHMIGFGYATGCKELEQRATMFALQHFELAVAQDRPSFLVLEEEVVASMLHNEHLQASEAAMLAAALAWVRHSPVQRRSVLPTLLECVVEGLSPQQLAVLMQEPLVLTDPSSYKVVTAMCFKHALLGTADAPAAHTLLAQMDTDTAPATGTASSRSSRGSRGEEDVQQQQQQEQEERQAVAAIKRLRLGNSFAGVAAVH